MILVRVLGVEILVTTLLQRVSMYPSGTDYKGDLHP